MTQTVTILHDALTVLHNEGWYQGTYYDLSGAVPGVCALGAINVAAGRIVKDEETGRWGWAQVAGDWTAYCGAMDILRDQVPVPDDIECPEDYGVASYNDTPGRTFPEIEALFQAAISEAEANATSYA